MKIRDLGRAACVVVPTILTGCTTAERPWAVEEQSLAAQRQYGEAGRLDGEDEARVEQALFRLADGHVPSRRPASAPDGIRWDDLPAAVTEACAEVQMAVVRAESIEGGARYQLRTVEDRPASLTVLRIEATPFYRAEAHVGRFDDEPERARALLAALDRQWRAFGRKKRLN